MNAWQNAHYLAALFVFISLLVTTLSFFPPITSLAADHHGAILLAQPSAAPQPSCGPVGLNLKHYDATWMRTKDLFANESSICGGGRTIPDDKQTLAFRLRPESPQGVLARASLKRRVALVMHDDRSMDPLKTLDIVTAPVAEFQWPIHTWYINALFCVRHGYDLYFVGGANENRHPSWGKLRAVKALLPHYDYLLFLDSDAYVRRQNWSVEDLAAWYGVGPGKGAPTGVIADSLLPLASDVGGNRLLVSKDIDNAPYHIANFGVFCIYAPTGLDKSLVGELLIEMWNKPLKEQRYRDNQFGNDWVEQGVFNGIWKDWSEKVGISIAPNVYITSPNGEFIRHWTGDHARERPQAIKEAFMAEFMEFFADVLHAAL